MFTQLKEKVNLFKTKSSSNSRWTGVLNKLQELGKALQFPIAVLPFAAILNRFGALGVEYTTNGAEILSGAGNQIAFWISFIIQQPGAVVFDQLPLLFAIGVAFGLSKDHRGEVALVGAIFYFALIALTSVERSLPSMIYGRTLGFDTYSLIVKDDSVIDFAVNKSISSLFYVPIYESFSLTSELAEKFNSTFGTNFSAGDQVKMITSGAYVLNIGVLGGITSGCFAAYFYNKFKDTQLPQALSFFSGRRFVPMVALVAVVPTAFAFAIVWPWIQYILMKFGSAVADPSNPGVAIPGTAMYAILNRLLLPFGLHQILNTFFWFQLPIQGHTIAPITGAQGPEIIVNGDINAFAKGVEGSGLFQGGFFPIMMGGVPGIAIAMILAAKPENRKQVAGFLGGVAMVSFVSGITEPIEFSFAFLSPVLLVIHALLTGVFVAISTAMQIQIGFGFSAGLIDYIASFAQSWGFAASKEGAFKVLGNPLWTLLLTLIAFSVYVPLFYISITKLNIITPGREENFTQSVTSKNETIGKNAKKENKFSIIADEVLNALGHDNIVSIDNCTTRLRLILKDTNAIDEQRIKACGAFGIKKLGKESLQIVFGVDVVFIAEAMREKFSSADFLQAKKN